MMRRLFVLIVAALASAWGTCATAESNSPDFTKDVAPIFAKYCSGCHNDNDLEGELSLVSFEKLKKGGEKGAVVVPGRADASLMIRMLTGEVEPAMPPKDEAQPSEEEIKLLRSWIDAGATGPDGKQPDFPELSTPKIKPAADVHQYLTSLAISPDGKQLVLGGYRSVEIVDPVTRQVVAKTQDLPGKVNSMSFTRDGKKFVAASGIPGLYGVATICKGSDGSIVSKIKGHKDTLYSACFSPDGQFLATGSYDRELKLWKVSTGEHVRTLAGHNGAIFDVAFSSDGSVLASASADATIKLWNVKTGERLDTLGQPESEQCAVAFTPDGKSIVAGGADRQLRMWQLVSRERAEINPLKFSRTAHDSSIVKLACSPNGTRLVSASAGRELVLWDLAQLAPVHRFEKQPDVVTGVAFEPDGGGFYVSRMNGSWARYTLSPDDRQSLAKNETASPVGNAVSSDKNAAKTEVAEHEPNDSVATATAISNSSTTTGVVTAAEKGRKPDVDLYRFHARNGERLVLEINASRSKSPLDSKLEVLDAAAKPIPRVVLQAVRTSYFTFRGHNSTALNDFRLHGAADMEFNDYLYANGEVMKLWMNPRGPDSGFLVYPGYNDVRFTYFGTTAITHPLNETCYIVEPHRPDEVLIPNGLPRYTLFYENDDEEFRKLGSDSRIAFTAPADGEYVARVSDVRGQGGDTYKYQLVVRPPKPSFTVSLAEKDRTVNAGGGKEFAVIATRKDEFDGEIKIEIKDLPPGFHVTSPLTIQAGQTTAYGVLSADADAPAPTTENANMAKVFASAMIEGKLVKRKPLEFGEIKLAIASKLLIRILPAVRPKADKGSAQRPIEISIAPGETIPVVVKLERNGYEGEVKFGTEFAGRNLPHGVYVDNIGLNGVTLLKGETERTIFLTARKWVPEQSRPFHLRSTEEGNQTSLPVMLHVRKGLRSPATSSNAVAATPDAN